MTLPNWLRQLRNRFTGKQSRRPIRRASRLAVEPLEARDVPATISVSDASISEAEDLSVFVPANQAVLTNSADLGFGPDRNGDLVADLYVVGRNSDNVVVYDGQTGAFVEEFLPKGAGLDGAAWLVFGPDGDLFTSTVTETGYRDSILRVDQVTGLVSTFITNNPAENGGLRDAKGMAFGPDGHFYVADTTTDRVLRYHGTTGAFLGTFVDAGSSGLDPADVLFGHDRNNDTVSDFYVSSNLTDEVLVYSGADGTPLGAFVSAGSGGLDGPHDMAFGPDGHLYVVNSGTNLLKIYRFNGATGTFIDVVVPDGLSPTTDFITFDGRGDMYIANENASNVLRYSAGPLVTLSEASASTITVDYSTTNGTATAGADYAALSGTLTFAPGETSKRILLSASGDGIIEATETFTLVLSNPVGATIADGTGEATILDNDSTKFYVVNDGSPDRTYEYGRLGNSTENYGLNSGNTAPRGASSTAAGDRVWVVDANKKVYVYNASGGILGSWTAGGLVGSAKIEGIATNGTDIWLVDAKSDKVFRYPSAAGRLTGNQNATSSFSLFNKGPFSPDYSNTNPTDMVTDGTHIWVLNDGVSEDKVFKYTMAGVMVWNNGWGIDPSNSQPTGITLDPSNPNHFWIVDAGTRRIYQYNGAVSWVGGGLPQPASKSFALAPGNTNPQGIADPPVSVGVSTFPVETATQRASQRGVTQGRVPALLDGTFFGSDDEDDENEVAVSWRTLVPHRLG